MTQAAVIAAGAARAAHEVPTEEVLGQLAARGAVIFRGFDSDPDAFSQLTKCYSDRFTCDPSKPRKGMKGGTRAAPRAGYGLNPHNENTFLPGGCPDLVWFLCVRSAQHGGRSALCDGKELLDALEPRTREFLAGNQVRYEIKLPRKQWQSVYGVKSKKELKRELDSIDSLQYRVDLLGRLNFRFDVPFLQPMSNGSGSALRTNVLSRRPYRATGDVEPETLANGSPMPAWVVQDLLDKAGALTTLVELEPGDILLLDNSRVMHGREPFDDPERRLLVRCSWLNHESRSRMAADGG